MKHSEFYDYLDSELDAIISSEVYSSYFIKHKQDEQKKSAAFLIWFLKTYADTGNVEEYITDGHDDFSCDIILDKNDSQRVKSYYIVQSKWNNKKNCDSEFDGKELKSFLSDIQSVLKGKKEKGANEKFNEKYDELREHIKNNGRVKVIFLSLKNNCDTSNDNIRSLKEVMSGDIDVEGFDINGLKIDFINREYKKSIPPNPLDNIYDPGLERIEMQVCRDGGNSCVEIKAPFNAYVFIVRPKIIYELVNKYGVSLFDRNVRNPISNSIINDEIKNTIQKNPAYFWYYNNGITGITRRIPKISNEAERFEITGLQIINGAQTAYSIYSAYKECNDEQRAILDEEVKITFRLLKSGGDEFDLKVTKYTNSQNPVNDRDFWSNDPVQQSLQNYFFATSFWYEKREGEFKEVPEHVDKIANFYFGAAYWSFCHNGAVDLMNSSFSLRDNDVDLLFVSRIDNQEGLYEKVFNKNVLHREFHASFIMLDQAAQIPFLRGLAATQLRFSNSFHLLSIARVVMEKYLKAKYGPEVQVIPFILKEAGDYKCGEKVDILLKIMIYSFNAFFEEIEEKDEDEQSDYFFTLLSKSLSFEMLIEKIKAKDISIDDIESQDLAKLEAELDEEDDDPNFEGGLVH
ncbi:AIPR family protein [Enterobacter asburiae]|uniref:AIPR family protein n=1 Tax=Enterobacter asburiae TaxID=61645 RepID=UPI00192ABDDE|nr:AIPR family protein [Enterobacter asburiae]MBL5946066.1 AIPR family protein [Enterobacter asburiae]MBL5954559.1 AIPR family protein [Enterobacter asburiae]